MTDPRCNCGEADCPICQAPAHQPWTPKPGESLDPLMIENNQLHEANAYLMAQLQSNRWHAFRSYITIMLMSLLGGMIGGMTSAITILHYLD